MLSSADIQAQALRQYPSVLRAIATSEPAFPKDVRFGRPKPTAEWPPLQTEISALIQTNAGYEIEWEEANTRRWGRQRLPVRVWFKHEADFLRMIGKEAEVEQFRRNLALSRHHCPELEGWLSAHVTSLVDHAHTWPDVLQVCRYFIDHPRPGCHARELPVPVGTKFIEERHTLFRNLFDYLLPTDTIVSESEHFETRYGLRFDEPLIRLRTLDPMLTGSLHLPATDLSMPVSECRLLPWSGQTVLIVENKMTFLTLPPLPGILAIWGGGDAAMLLTSMPWLTHCQLFYWGDLDVHGFHILARLRQTFNQVQSVLMEIDLLDRFTANCITAGSASYEHTIGLTAAERTTYARLNQDRTLLEQEKLPHAFVVETLRARVSARSESL